MAEACDDSLPVALSDVLVYGITNGDGSGYNSIVPDEDKN